MTDNLGLYLHIPFCNKKCRYCDFYSSFLSEELLDKYTEALIREIYKWGGGLNGRPINTVYLGGGTPSLLAERLPEVLNAVRSAFKVESSSEITLEINPTESPEQLLSFAKAAGVNRLSIGAQSGIDAELKLLGRTHTVSDTENTVSLAKQMGFDNISLDIMLGLPDSDETTLKQSLEFITAMAPQHISAYILKIEENTAFWAKRDTLNLPDDEKTAAQYLFMCDFLKNKGFLHYEISNFAKECRESRHNLKYWQGAEYLGLGPSAHSFLNGKRFYYPRDLKGFIKGNCPLPDGDGGDKEEYIMLALRLSHGVSFEEYKNRFGEALPQSFFDKCLLFEKAGLMCTNDLTASLTNNGMLLSNSIITELLECIE